MINVWHVAYAHGYDDPRIIEKECRSLCESKKYNVTYVMSDLSFNLSELPYKIYGVNLVGIKTHKNKIIRLFKYISDVKTTIKNQDEEILICHIHEHKIWPLVPFLKRKGIKVILDVHEDSVNDFMRRISRRYGKFAGNACKLILSHYESHIIKKADAYITVTFHTLEKAKKYCSNNAIVTNFPRIEKTKKLRTYDEYKIYGNVLCFAGGISEIWSQNVIIAALDRLPKCKYILAGFGNDDYIEALKRHRSWDNRVNFLGKIPYSEVWENVYAKAGIGIALLTRDIFIDGQKEKGTLGNTKLFEFMENGLPVICTDFEIWRDIIKKNCCGITVEPDDVDGVASAIQYLIDNPEEAYEMGQRGRKAIEETLNWQNEEKKLLKIYDEVLKCCR